MQMQRKGTRGIRKKEIPRATPDAVCRRTREKGSKEVCLISGNGETVAPGGPHGRARERPSCLPNYLSREKAMDL